MKTVITDAPLAEAAERISEILEKKPDAVIALEGVKELGGLFEMLGDKCSAARIFAVTDRSGVLREILSGSTVKEENITCLTDENMAHYDGLIASAGGIDIAVIGIGVNARIGYNEIATPFDSLTHRQKLTTKTKNELAIAGEEVFGLTMGIKTIAESRNIILVAIGGSRSEAIYKMLYARTDSTVPAAFLQVPLNVTVIADRDAAEKL